MDAYERSRDDGSGGPLRTELENLREKASEILADRQTFVAVYRPELSYRPTGFNFSEVRFVLMNQHLTPAAQEAQYAADIKGHMEALGKADANRHWYVYRVIAGAPTGTGFLIEPFRSLREMDPFLESPGRLFDSTYLSTRSPEIGIFAINLRTSYPEVSRSGGRFCSARRRSGRRLACLRARYCDDAPGAGWARISFALL